MGTIIAVVELAAGRVAFFDPISRVHLTLSNKQSVIYSHINTTAIKRAVKNGTLKLVQGSLEVEAPVQEKPKAKTAPAEVTPQPLIEVKEEIQSVDQVVEETIEEAVQEVKQEVVEETEATPKKKSKKK